MTFTFIQHCLGKDTVYKNENKEMMSKYLHQTHKTVNCIDGARSKWMKVNDKTYPEKKNRQQEDVKY